jgi:outer membrane protein TolC
MYRLLPVGLAVWLAGCQSYEPRPLVPPDVLRAVEQSRDLLDEAGAVRNRDRTDSEGRGIRLPQAARWMRTRSPHLGEARAAFLKAWSLADTATPLPNPELVVGPLIGTHLSETVGRAIQPLVEFGFTIPIAGRLARQNDVNASRAIEAQTRLVVTYRREYLTLRRLYTAWALNHRREKIQEAVIESARKSLEVTRRLVKAGEAIALDTGLREIELAERELELLEIRARRTQIVKALSALLGVNTRHLRAPSPGLRSGFVLPDLRRAKEILVANHPRLVELRAAYQVADQELRLEIARQYPDITFGATYAGDPGATKNIWGLTLGIPIPVFDRNQQGVVVARKERDRVRAAYEAELSRALAALEGAYAEYEVVVKKRQLIETVILAKSKANLAIAGRSMEAGTFDSLKFLVVARTLRAVQIERVKAEQDVQRVMSEIEQFLGTPLGLFPGESDGTYPYVPETIEAPAESGEPPSPLAPEDPSPRREEGKP